MRWRGLILCAAVAVSACGGASAATDSSSKGPTAPRSTGVPCGPAGATTLAASSVARVYASRGTVFGCSSHASGAVQLGQTRTCIGRAQVGLVAVKGELAAYGVRRCGVDTGQGSVVVERLDTRRTLDDDAAVTGRLRPESYTQVSALVLKLDGAVAWIGTGASVISSGTEAIEVHKIDRTGARLLDSSRQIAESSLRLHGSRLSWRHGRSVRTARLV